MNRLKKLRKNKKGFTLVEMIVVLVILAILAAVLVPALLGYIDKAKEKQITTDANAAYTAAQSLADEAYAMNASMQNAVTAVKIKDLTDIEKDFSIKIGCKGTTGKNKYKIEYFSFAEKGATTVYLKSNGDWSTSATDAAGTAGVGLSSSTE